MQASTTPSASASGGRDAANAATRGAERPLGILSRPAIETVVARRHPSDSTGFARCREARNQLSRIVYQQRRWQIRHEYLERNRAQIRKRAHVLARWPETGLEREVDIGTARRERDFVREVLGCDGEGIVGRHDHHGRDAARRRREAATCEVFLVGQPGLAEVDVRIDDAR